MKRSLCMLLPSAMLMGLGACASPGELPQTGTTAAAPSSAVTITPASYAMQVGFARADITPRESVALAGYGNSATRRSKNVLDYLEASCVAVGDGEQTMVLVTLDLTAPYYFLQDVRTGLAVLLKIPETNVMFCASHTHSSPDLADKSSYQTQYNQALRSALLKLGKEAVADMKGVTGMYYASTETEGLNFVRRYVLENGTCAGANYGDFRSSPIKCHESEADNLLQLVKFTRAGGKDVVLTNFQVHNHRTGSSKSYDISADLVGVYRDEMEKQLDCHCLYFNGAAGNLNPTSRIDSENRYDDYRAQGKALARYGLQAAKSFAPLEPGKLQSVKKVYVGNVDHSADHLIEYAREIQKRVKSGMSNAEAAAPYLQYGIQSAFHASSIITKYDMAQTKEAPLYAMRMGNMAFVFAPYELFDQLGMQIREGSPFAHTFVCCYANVSLNYMPSQLGWDNGGYEPYSCRFEPGTGEKLVQEYLTLLNTLHQGR